MKVIHQDNGISSIPNSLTSHIYSNNATSITLKVLGSSRRCSNPCSSLDKDYRVFYRRENRQEERYDSDTKRNEKPNHQFFIAKTKTSVNKGGVRNQMSESHDFSRKYRNKPTRTRRNLLKPIVIIDHRNLIHTTTTTTTTTTTRTQDINETTTTTVTGMQCLIRNRFSRGKKQDRDHHISLPQRRGIRNHSTTKMLVLISTMFIIMNLPR